MAVSEATMTLLLSDHDYNVVGRSVIEHYHFYRSGFGGRERMVLYVVCAVDSGLPAWLTKLCDRFHDISIETKRKDDRNPGVTAHYMGDWFATVIDLQRDNENPVVVFESFVDRQDETIYPYIFVRNHKFDPQA